MSYAVQGYLMAQEDQVILFHSSTITGYVLLQLVVFNSKVQQVKTTVIKWIISDAIHLIMTLVFTFLILFVLSYLELFEDLLLILAAEIFVRIDLQQKGLRKIQKILFLSLCLTLGLVLGWITHMLIG